MLAPFEESQELTDVLIRVRSWSAKARSELMQHLVELSHASIASAEDSPTLDDLEGIFDSGSPALTDEECDRWIEEERIRKYG